jgi:hypothetical protein
LLTCFVAVQIEAILKGDPISWTANSFLVKVRTNQKYNSV